MLHFLFPANPLDPRAVDEHWAPQREALLDAGFPATLVADAVFDGRARVAGIAAGATVVYRGWMVDEGGYRSFDAAVRAAGAEPLTAPERYLLAHHLPNWYPLLRDLTPETVVLPKDADLEKALRELGWPAFFIKDYVKSLKTSAGSLIADPSEARRVAEDMRRFRGDIEGGFCIRRVEQFAPGSEVRYFVLRSRAFAPGGAPVPDIVLDVAARVDHPFFTVDVAANESGRPRVVEIGDGQVSDLVGWSAREFARMWQEGG